MRDAVFAVHFFNWYWTSSQRPLPELEKEWTFHPAWEEMGILPEEIGHTRNYYQRQFESIRQAGFDAVMWEWHNPWPRNRGLVDELPWAPHGSAPPPDALAAAQDVGLRFGMFYDLEIRFRSFPAFIYPAPPLAELLVEDVRSFYQSIPEDLWLLDRNGSVPIIVYGYKFSKDGVSQQWHDFYRSLINGCSEALGRTVVLHWTDAGCPEQAYAYQHYKEIRAFTFNPCHPQSSLAADSVTFVLSYDDYGVWQGNQEKPGEREFNLIIDDPRLVEESLALCQASDPSLIFFYGWNEFFEGEALFPDTVHGRSRLELAAALVHELRGARPTAMRPTAVLVCDDLLPLARLSRELAAREIKLLQVLRPIFPGAVTLLVQDKQRQETAEVGVYVTLDPPPGPGTGEPPILWLSPSGETRAGPGVLAVSAAEDLLGAVRQGVHALGISVHDGVLFTAHAIRASRAQVVLGHSVAPSSLPVVPLPANRIVLTAARALAEEELRLPSGWQNPSFHWLRGTARPLSVDNGCIRLRYPDVVEIRRS
jgi:hypothetical protein